MNEEAGRSALVVIGVAVIIIVLMCLAVTIGLALFRNISIVPTPTYFPLT